MYGYRVKEGLSFGRFHLILKKQIKIIIIPTRRNLDLWRSNGVELFELNKQNNQKLKP